MGIDQARDYQRSPSIDRGLRGLAERLVRGADVGESPILDCCEGGKPSPTVRPNSGVDNNRIYRRGYRD